MRSEGFFELKTASGRQSLIAAHADRRESDLTVIPKETLDLWRATGQSDQTAAGASALRGHEQTRSRGACGLAVVVIVR